MSEHYATRPAPIPSDPETATVTNGRGEAFPACPRCGFLCDPRECEENTFHRRHECDGCGCIFKVRIGGLGRGPTGETEVVREPTR